MVVARAWRCWPHCPEDVGRALPPPPGPGGEGPHDTGSLRAAETNAGEKVVRKKTIQAEAKGGVVTVTVPYRVDGKLEGIGQGQEAAAPKAAHWGWRAVLLAAGAFLALGCRATGRCRSGGTWRGAWTSGAAAIVAYAGAGRRLAAAAAGRDARADRRRRRRHRPGRRVRGAGRAGWARRRSGAGSPWDTDLLRPPGWLVCRPASRWRRDRGLPLRRAPPSSSAACGTDGWAWWCCSSGRALLGAQARTAGAYGTRLGDDRVWRVLVFFPFAYGRAGVHRHALSTPVGRWPRAWVGLDNFTPSRRLQRRHEAAPKAPPSTTELYWTLMMTGDLDRHQRHHRRHLRPRPSRWRSTPNRAARACTACC